MQEWTEAVQEAHLGANTGGMLPLQPAFPDQEKAKERDPVSDHLGQRCSSEEYGGCLGGRAGVETQESPKCPWDCPEKCHSFFFVPGIELRGTGPRSWPDFLYFI
ncbi:hypothetical protein H1C71_021351 [Ictidomys tridecemlineatus]|nr:hypothetical protein H1C71_021351 [Ictidomys tridecemlineatus]